jgi:hypothetical protein
MNTGGHGVSGASGTWPDKEEVPGSSPGSPIAESPVVEPFCVDFASVSALTRSPRGLLAPSLPDVARSAPLLQVEDRFRQLGIESGAGGPPAWEPTVECSAGGLL